MSLSPAMCSPSLACNLSLPATCRAACGNPPSMRTIFSVLPHSAPICGCHVYKSSLFCRLSPRQSSSRRRRLSLASHWISGGRRSFLEGALALSLSLPLSPSLSATSLSPMANLALEPLIELDANGLERMIYREEGYESWTWKGHKINYVNVGDNSKDPIVLVHGFGASVYHWRYNIPALAEKFNVFAIDLLGFGWSDKAIVDYSAALWREQLSDFLTQVVGGPAVLVGNSVGGYAVLSTAAYHPSLVRGLVLVNAAGRFERERERERDGEGEEVVEGTLVDDAPGAVGLTTNQRAWTQRFLESIKKIAKRGVLYLTFLQAKQPGRIRQVLLSVYPNNQNVDNLLVESIVKPAQDPNAAEVYFRLTSEVLLDPSAISINKLLKKLDNMPVLLLWGDLDPWMTPSKADKILDLYPMADRVRLMAGHCPHDEAPEPVNKALEQWMATL